MLLSCALQLELKVGEYPVNLLLDSSCNTLINIEDRTRITDDLLSLLLELLITLLEGKCEGCCKIVCPPRLPDRITFDLTEVGRGQRVDQKCKKPDEDQPAKPDSLGVGRLFTLFFSLFANTGCSHLALLCQPQLFKNTHKTTLGGVTAA